MRGKVSRKVDAAPLEMPEQVWVQAFEALPVIDCVRAVRCAGPVEQSLQNLAITSGAAGKPRHCPLGKHVAALLGVDDVAIGVDEPPLCLGIDAALGPERLPCVGAQEIVALLSRDQLLEDEHDRSHGRDELQQDSV